VLVRKDGEDVKMGVVSLEDALFFFDKLKEPEANPNYSLHDLSGIQISPAMSKVNFNQISPKLAQLVIAFGSPAIFRDRGFRLMFIKSLEEDALGKLNFLSQIYSFKNLDSEVSASNFGKIEKILRMKLATGQFDQFLKKLIAHLETRDSVGLDLSEASKSFKYFTIHPNSTKKCDKITNFNPLTLADAANMSKECADLIPSDAFSTIDTKFLMNIAKETFVKIKVEQIAKIPKDSFKLLQKDYILALQDPETEDSKHLCFKLKQMMNDFVYFETIGAYYHKCYAKYGAIHESSGASKMVASVLLVLLCLF
jgi:hypothetical protein